MNVESHIGAELLAHFHIKDSSNHTIGYYPPRSNWGFINGNEISTPAEILQ